MVKNYLKTLLLATFAMMLPLVASADVEINETTFPDEGFRNWVLRQSYGQDGPELNKIATLPENILHNR